MRAISFTILWAVLALPGAPARAEGIADPLFQSSKTLEVVITAPLSTLLNTRPEETYLEGAFSYKAPDGSDIDLDLKIRARGNFRYRNCDFPPVTLNFRKSQVVDTLLDQQDKLKMVPHCKITRRYEQSVLREYLAYRLFGILTDVSFNVRLLHVTWVDSEGRRGRMVRSAFVIEDKGRLEHRIGRKEQELPRTQVNAISPEHLNLASLFQYMIGNFDFSPIVGSEGKCCHNYTLFGSAGEPMVAIPYDFDFAGMVNTPNAVVNEEMGVERIGQRVYHGYCANNRYLGDSVTRFNEVRDAIYSEVAGLEELEPTLRRRIANYMDEFYEVINDPRKLEREIIENCKQ